MKKKTIIKLAVSISIILLIVMVRTFNSPERVTIRYFNAHIEELKAASVEYENNGTISADLDASRYIWSADGENTIIEYTVLGKGFASATQYYGVFYSPNDVPVSFHGSYDSLIPLSNNVWGWKDVGDNGGLVKKIEDNWYYFEAHF